MGVQRHVGKSTGIYQTETIGTFRHDSPAEDLDELHQLLRAGNDLDGRLSYWESHANQVLRAEGLAFPAALFAKDPKPIAETAAQLIAEIGNLRTLLAKPTPDVQEIARQALRVGWREAQLAVRPFEALVHKGKRVIERNGRSCVVTDDEHRMLCYLRDNSEAGIHDFVRHAFGELYNVEHRARYDQRRSRLNRTLSKAKVGLSIDISGDTLTLAYF